MPDYRSCCHPGKTISLGVYETGKTPLERQIARCDPLRYDMSMDVQDDPDCIEQDKKKGKDHKHGGNVQACCLHS